MADNHIETGNLTWGFFGTLAQHGHDEAACAALYNATAQRMVLHGMTPEEAVEALDSRWGRHLADWIGADHAAVIDGDTEAVVTPADSDGLLQAVTAGHFDPNIIRHWKTGLRVMAGIFAIPLEEDR